MRGMEGRVRRALEKMRSIKIERLTWDNTLTLNDARRLVHELANELPDDLTIAELREQTE